ALNTMESLERYRGHFYNSYDTQTRLPLAPRYVSTVDSGNLAGHLLTLRPGLTALIDAPILSRRWLDGVSDTFSILVDAVGKGPRGAVLQFQKALELAAAARPVTLSDAWVEVERLAARAADAAAYFTASGTDGSSNSDSEGTFWAGALARQCADLRDELVLLAPWLDLRAVPGTGPDFPGDNSVPTLRELAAWSPMIEPARSKGTIPAGQLDAVQPLVTQGAG